ncbi:TPA: hypothetical protein DEP90_00185 [Patescibacteria group bacterium]|nr:hypothetical protein [Patescibacteria group bacterium]
MITVGEVLKKQRELLNKTLDEVSLDTKIQLRFLKYIEANTFDRFDSDVYAQGFIKIYTNYLNLNEDRILAIYRRSMPAQQPNKGRARETIKSRKIKLPVTPRLLAILISVSFLLGVLFYIGYQIYQFQSPPNISISTPTNESTVEDEIITIEGTTDKNSSLLINDSPIEISEDGSFKTDISLNIGINLITIVAKKGNNTQESVETLKVTYTPPQETEEETQRPNTVKLSIINSSVWIQLNVDKINKLSQILQVGNEYEYEVKEDFSLITGKIGSTKIYFNDEELNIPANSNNVGSLSCQINDNQIDCE